MTKLKVLILGGELADAERMVDELCRAGFEPDWGQVQSKEDYIIALQRAAAMPGKLDLILADLSLPSLDPLSALHLLRQQELRVPLIVVADAIHEGSVVACVREGAADYVVKERLARLGPAVERVLREGEARDVGLGGRETSARRSTEAEEVLQMPAIRYRTLVEQLPAIIYVTSFTEAAATFYVSPQIEQILGFSQIDWTDGPKLWLKHLHPEDRMRVLSEVADSYATGDRFVSEYRLIARDGRTLWFHDEATVVRDDAGVPAYLQGVRLDVTERKRTDETLRRRNRELELLNHASQAFSSSLDLEDVLSTVLEEVRHLLGVAAASIWLLDPEANELVCQQAAGERSDALLGWRLPLDQGVAGWVVRNNESLIVPDALTDPRHYQGVLQQTGLPLRSILSVPMRAKRGVIGVVQVLDTAVGRFSTTDLTLLESLTASAASAVENAWLYEQAQLEIAERARAERALQEERAGLAQRVAERTAELSAANAELARSARLKDEFLAAMSHELRTPLNAILGLSEALQEEVYGPLNERQSHSLNSIEQSGRHLLELINDILDIAKIEAGKLELQLGTVGVRSVCEASLGLVRQMAMEKHLGVSSTLDSRITTIEADARRLKQLLVNLLSNAVKFTPDGGKIGLEVEGDVEGETVRFTVWDTGIGISREEMVRLFQPFVQLDSSLSRQHAGTGLGLALVRRLAELHGGGVSLESVVGEGSRFSVTIPWRQPARAAEVRDSSFDPVAARLSAADESTETSRLAKLQPLILLADDNEANVTTVLGYLQRKGCRIVVARSGLEAIERAREELPDAILMDIQMPGMDGLEAIRRIRAGTSRGLASVPIVALTALAMPGDRARCLQAGASAYLSKPVRLRELVEVLEEQLGAIAKA